MQMRKNDRGIARGLQVLLAAPAVLMSYACTIEGGVEDALIDEGTGLEGLAMPSEDLGSFEADIYDEANATCNNGDTRTVSCDPGTYCPPGTQTQMCSNGQWLNWTVCKATVKYYGDGGKHCGPEICIQISGFGSNSQLQATITKNGGGTFANDVNLSVYSPTTGKSVQYGCLATKSKASYSFGIPPSQLGMVLGSTIAVNAQVFSPCVGGANYISSDGYISQCGL
jgi:hypothetical protein